MLLVMLHLPWASFGTEEPAEVIHREWQLMGSFSQGYMQKNNLFFVLNFFSQPRKCFLATAQLKPVKSASWQIPQLLNFG